MSRRVRSPKQARRHWGHLLYRSGVTNDEVRQLVAEVDAARLLAAIGDEMTKNT
jgi:hypothetical protein